MADETYDLGLLDSSAEKWKNSPALREAYGDIYRRMGSKAEPGPALEVGSGCGFIREFIDSVVTSDIRKTRFVDTAASAYAIEQVPGGPWQTIYLLDVLHHLRRPFEFFQSASRAVKPGGRIVLAEPAATPFGRLFYRLFHHEPMSLGEIQGPHEYLSNSERREFANMAMAWCLFVRDRQTTFERLSRTELSAKSIEFRDLIAYPATGGFSKPNILPASFCRILLRSERLIPQVVMRFLGLRMLVVLEKAIGDG